MQDGEGRSQDAAFTEHLASEQSLFKRSELFEHTPVLIL